VCDHSYGVKFPPNTGGGVFFFGVYSNKQTNKQTIVHRRTCLRDFSTNFPGNSKSENPALCELFMLKLLEPPLLVRICFTTLEHKNIYMIHGMRGFPKVAKSCNKIYIPQKCVCKYIYVYVSRPCALCPLLIHILLYHSCSILILCRAEWVLLVRWHLPELPLIHQPERLAAPSSAFFVCLFVGVKPEKIYSASCWEGRQPRFWGGNKSFFFKCTTQFQTVQNTR